MSANFGFGWEYTEFSGSLAESKLIVTKRNERYSKVLSWVRRKINFSQMNSIGLFLCGSRSV